MPFPSEETTPPVTKMYLVAFGPVVIGLPLKCVPVGFRPSKVFGGIDARAGPARSSRATPMRDAVVQRPQLLQPLGQLGRRWAAARPSGPAPSRE